MGQRSLYRKFASSLKFTDVRPSNVDRLIDAPNGYPIFSINDWFYLKMG